MLTYLSPLLLYLRLMKEIAKKRTKKESREQKVLLGLVELYLKTGKPIGSHTLQENGFEDLSSATIRNYFSELEERGYLKQAHSSGGRIPTSKAFRYFAFAHFQAREIDPEDEEKLQSLKQEETKNLSAYLYKAAELLSELTGYATFLNSVRFDHDFILEIKIVSIDTQRSMCILITDFGQILTEILPHEKRISSFSLKRMENYCQWRLKGANDRDKPPLLPEEESLAKEFYTEIMVRYLVRYSNYSNEEIYRIGFSRLLTYPEFNDPIALSSALSLFENNDQMRQLLNDCSKSGDLSFLIGSDLASYKVTSSACAVVAIPYRIGQHITGAIGILGPSRMSYHTLFGILHTFADILSETLTKSLYKFKLSYRNPRSTTPYLETKNWSVDREKSYKLLEIKESQ